MINAAIEALPPSSGGANTGELIITTGVYRLDHQIIVSGLQNAIVSGTGNTRLLWAGGQTEAMMLLRNVQQSAIRDLVFEAGNPNYSWQKHAQSAIESRSVFKTASARPSSQGALPAWSSPG